MIAACRSRPRTRRRARCATAAAAGIAATVHAIGDAAVRRALDLMAAVPRVAVPHRIEHFQCVHPADLDRAAAAGIVVSMQPAHLLTDIPLVERHWGARGRGAYAFETLRRRGTALVFGSDVPGRARSIRGRASSPRSSAGTTTGGPRGGWRPEEKLGFEDGGRAAYTVGAAHAAGARSAPGRLAPGPTPIWWRGRSTPPSSAAPATRFARAGRASPWCAARS